MTDEVYILSGSSGSYESASEWTVAVYEGKTEAEAAAKNLNDAVVEFAEQRGRDRTWVDLRDFFVEHKLSLETIPYSGDLEDLAFCVYAAKFIAQRSA